MGVAALAGLGRAGLGMAVPGGSRGHRVCLVRSLGVAFSGHRCVTADRAGLVRRVVRHGDRRSSDRAHGTTTGYDLTKWASVNYLPSLTGYFKVAREQAAGDPWKFLTEYPRWIRSQDSLHIGTHPPGLIATQCFLLQTMKTNPGLVKALLEVMPASVEAGFRIFGSDDPRPLLPAERAALRDGASDTPGLRRHRAAALPAGAPVLPARVAWVAAALWPLAPAANLFQPVADTAYPFLSTLALALTAWSARLQGGASRPRPGCSFWPPLRARRWPLASFTRWRSCRWGS